MSYRFEDRGLTLRLFLTDNDALNHPGARSPVRYGSGWIVQDVNGRWADAQGLLPADWQPLHVLLQDGIEGSLIR